MGCFHQPQKPSRATREILFAQSRFGKKPWLKSSKITTRFWTKAILLCVQMERLATWSLPLSLHQVLLKVQLPTAGASFDPAMVACVPLCPVPVLTMCCTDSTWQTRSAPAKDCSTKQLLRMHWDPLRAQLFPQLHHHLESKCLVCYLCMCCSCAVCVQDTC